MRACHPRILATLCLVTVICSGCIDIPSRQGLDGWEGFDFVVDGRLNLKLWVPPLEDVPAPDREAFVVSQLDSGTRLFLGFYDRGQGKYRGLHLTQIGAVIYRFDQARSDAGTLEFDEIKDRIFLPKRMADYRFRFPGSEMLGGREWLQVDLVGNWNEGVSFAYPLRREYVLVLSMTVIGESASSSDLFRFRFETIRQMIEMLEIEPVGESQSP